MGRLSVVLAALAAAACQVNVEGAACETKAQCPGGQSCGLDGRCTTARVACPTVDDRRFHFDPARVRWDDVVPTGAASPSACRLGSLEEALAALGDGPGTLVATGDWTEHPLAAPLELPSGVTLTNGDSATHTLAFATLDGPEAAAVVLRAGAKLEGFTVRNAGATTGRGIEVACDGGVATVTGVVVEGGEAGAQLAEGVHVGGRCDLVADGLVVRRVAGPGLAVDTAATGGSTVRGGELSFNVEGVRLRNGVLALDGVIVRENAKTGVVAGDGSTSVAELDAQDATIERNGDSGIVAFNLNRLRLASNVVRANTGSTARSAANRLVGGLVLRGNPPPELVLEGNVVSGNHGDQAIVYGTSSAATTWALDPGGCAERNTFGCYDPSGYGLAAVDCVVQARHASWQNAIPSTNGRDFRAFGSAQIDAGEATETFCAAAPACP